MSVRSRFVAIAALVSSLGLGVAASRAPVTGPPTAATSAALSAGFVEGAPGLQSAGTLAFGPEGTLFVGDSRGGAVYTFAIDDRVPDPHTGEVEIGDLDKRLARLLAIAPDQVVIRDMAVHPSTKHLYLSVTRGRAVTAEPVLVRSTLAGELSLVPMDRAQLLEVLADRRSAGDREDAVGCELPVDGRHGPRVQGRRAARGRAVERAVRRRRCAA